MDILESFLLADTFLLALTLIFILFASRKNGDYKKRNKKVREDLKKIKEQINAKE